MGHALDPEFHAFHRPDQFALRFPDVLRFAALLPCNRAPVSHGMVRRIAGNADSDCVRHSHRRKPFAKPPEPRADLEHSGDRGYRGSVPDFTARRIPWVHSAAIAVFSVPHRLDADVPDFGGIGEARVFRARQCAARESENCFMMPISKTPAAKRDVALTPGLAKFVALVS